jgi:hypothetical protein
LHLSIVSAIALSFPLRWPPALVALFDFQSASSTIGEALINPDCVSTTTTAAGLFYSKQIGFALMPFFAVIFAFVLWFVFGHVKKTPFFAKRENNKTTTPKDRFVVTVGVVIYLIYPQLCSQAFKIFDCKTVAGVQYLALDLEHKCYKDTHLAAVLLLGMSQLMIFVVGLPALMLRFLRRNRKKDGGLERQVTLVRYGLFFGA